VITFIFALIVLLIALAAIVIRKSYAYLPAKELKRRAASGDVVAVQLYRAVAYGGALDILLWVVIALTGAGGFVLLVSIAPTWISFIAVVLLLVVFYELLPASRLTSLGSQLTIHATPLIVMLLSGLHPVLSRGDRVLQKRYTERSHTGLYERSDLLALIEQQLSQEDSRFSVEELMIAAQALSFNDYFVHDIITPWAKVKCVTASDTVGPVVIDEAHRSGQPLVPVIESGEHGDRIVGTLRVQQLGLQSDGVASDLMDQTVYYLHEDDTLTEALHAFYVTNEPLFVVVNGKGDHVGVITMAAMLKQLLGELPGASAESYAEHCEIAGRHHANEQPVHDARVEQARTPNAFEAGQSEATVTENTAKASETVVE
jgi:CBS domain containing-hemolysin-like protein